MIKTGSNLQLRSELKQQNPEHSISGKYRTSPTKCHVFKQMPWFQKCHVFKNAMVSEMPCFQEGHVMAYVDLIPRTVRALQTLALSGGCALLVRSLQLKWWAIRTMRRVKGGVGYHYA
ncbi:hypothetical protein TIFTF001_037834 [Ficus carica]|uniref:Uncharacterized protein n=1 Tax=Ficus carica TaxID=3494 RepID=A0AA88E6W3_FICCA|nr:hypothetical protein TIFTF001_037823 [Ficus carica]GMN68777.1 hypothetical protein TIFTF001_037828 [Ficus carica]GMN68778.1 hypothetical protein TIFTF001_037829 [Ficus carica]GMN68783.1 hypothetical protein TIFTF001_037834 [Ficus carica]